MKALKPDLTNLFPREDFVVIPNFGRVGKNAELTAKRDEFMQLKRTVDHMVPNYTTGNVVARAAWDSASHVELPPKKKPTP